MKAFTEINEQELREILRIVYPAFNSDHYEVMKDKVEDDRRTIIFRSLQTIPNRRKYDVILHDNLDIDIYETYLATGSRGKIEMRNVVDSARYLLGL